MIINGDGKHFILIYVRVEIEHFFISGHRPVGEIFIRHCTSPVSDYRHPKANHTHTKSSLPGFKTNFILNSDSRQMLWVKLKTTDNNVKNHYF